MKSKDIFQSNFVGLVYTMTSPFWTVVEYIILNLHIFLGRKTKCVSPVSVQLEKPCTHEDEVGTPA